MRTGDIRSRCPAGNPGNMNRKDKVCVRHTLRCVGALVLHCLVSTTHRPHCASTQRKTHQFIPELDSPGYTGSGRSRRPRTRFRRPRPCGTRTFGSRRALSADRAGTAGRTRWQGRRSGTWGRGSRPAPDPAGRPVDGNTDLRTCAPDVKETCQTART